MAFVLEQVQANRGFNKLQLHQTLLEEIYDCLAELFRHSQPNHDVADHEQGWKVHLLPFTNDWYTDHNNDKGVWLVNAEARETRLYEYAAILWRLGIPSFLQEERPAKIPRTKLFFSLQATVDANDIPQEAERIPGSTSNPRQIALHGLRRELLSLFLEAALKTIRELFGIERSRSQLVAVFDASGRSSDLRGAWKLSLRINFLELSVYKDGLDRAHAAILKHLGVLWLERPNKCLRSLLKALPSQTGSQDSSTTFWEKIVDPNALNLKARHRLVWCDKIGKQALIPEKRPLLPHSLVLATMDPQTGIVEFTDQDEISRSLTSVDWSRMGSIWTASNAVQVMTPQQSQSQQPTARVAERVQMPPSSSPADGRTGNAHISPWDVVEGEPVPYQPVMPLTSSQNQLLQQSPQIVPQQPRPPPNVPLPFQQQQVYGRAPHQPTTPIPPAHVSPSVACRAYSQQPPSVQQLQFLQTAQQNFQQHNLQPQSLQGPQQPIASQQPSSSQPFLRPPPNPHTAPTYHPHALPQPVPVYPSNQSRPVGAPPVAHSGNQQNQLQHQQQQQEPSWVKVPPGMFGEYRDGNGRPYYTKADATGSTWDTPRQDLIFKFHASGRWRRRRNQTGQTTAEYFVSEETGLHSMFFPHGAIIVN